MKSHSRTKWPDLRDSGSLIGQFGLWHVWLSLVCVQKSYGINFIIDISTSGLTHEMRFERLMEVTVAASVSSDEVN